MTPEDYRRQVAEAFEASYVGQTFTFRRTFTDGDAALFCGVTGDYNPYHIDDTFAAASRFGRRNIPGLLTASMMTHIGGMLAFLARQFTLEFLGPVYAGDTITCTVTIVEKDVDRRRLTGEARFVNQDGAEVLRARFTGFPGDIRLAR